MTIEKIKKARSKAERFLVCVDKVLKESVRRYDSEGRQTVADTTFETEYLDTGKNTGALKRASLDLWRSLAKMRKP